MASSPDNAEDTYNHIHGVIDVFLKKLDSKDIRKKSYKKSSKIIYEEVHNTFLKKYQDINLKLTLVASFISS